MTSEPSTISLAGIGIGGQDITVTGDFFISLEFTAIGFAGEVASDSGPTQGHSYDSATTPPSFVLLTSGGNYMIGAEVEYPPAVGGEIVPVNQFQVLVPWLGLIAALSILSVEILIGRRRTAND